MIGIGIITTNKDLTSELMLHLPVCKTRTTTQTDAKGKNKILKELRDCDYVFLIYDYMKILDSTVFSRFILVSQKTGFECMGYGSSELSNQKSIYDNDPWVTYWVYPCSDFVFYTRKALEVAGLLNEGFPKNTWEDIEHIKRVGDYCLTAPFGYFIGIKDEKRYLYCEYSVKEKRAEEESRNHERLKEGSIYWQSLDPETFPEIPTKDDSSLKLKKAIGTMI